jgi:hypothetical protein
VHDDCVRGVRIAQRGGSRGLARLAALDDAKRFLEPGKSVLDLFHKSGRRGNDNIADAIRSHRSVRSQPNERSTTHLHETFGSSREQSVAAPRSE